MIKSCGFTFIKIDKGVLSLVESIIMMKQKSVFFLNINNIFTQLFGLVFYTGEMLRWEYYSMIYSCMERLESIVHNVCM